MTDVPDPHAERPLSALPSPAARAVAFAAILLGGLAGGLIGYSLVRVQCDGECALGKGLGTFIGAAVAAIGMSIVAVLVLRALGEWKSIEDRQSGR
jgi:hypothetical protein